MRPSRRQFLALLPGLLAAAATGGREAWAAVGAADPGGHPTPRPGIDASRVLSRAELAEHPAAIPVFDLVRRIPHVVDGIRCYCGCAERPDLYSLLSCFEQDGMAQECDVCQGEARLAHALHRQGKTLGEIRAAIDAKYG